MLLEWLRKQCNHPDLNTHRRLHRVDGSRLSRDRMSRLDRVLRVRKERRCLSHEGSETHTSQRLVPHRAVRDLLHEGARPRGRRLQRHRLRRRRRCRRLRHRQLGRTGRVSGLGSQHRRSQLLGTPQPRSGLFAGRGNLMRAAAQQPAEVANDGNASDSGEQSTASENLTRAAGQQTAEGSARGRGGERW